MTTHTRSLKSMLFVGACLMSLTSHVSAAELPGTGITVRPIKGDAKTTEFQELIVARGLEALGYEVAPFAYAKFPALHLAIANGDADYTASHWQPLHNAYFEKAGGESVMNRIGHLISGATQGYLIDKKTADEHNITNIADMAKPEIAALFDTDGDGKANLIGCDPGWGCEKEIDNHLKVYGLENSVNHDKGTYFALIADGIARYKAGEPIFYFTWTPLWLSNVLVPGKDTVYLDVPFNSQADGGTQDTSTPDGHNTGFQTNEIRVLARNEFSDANLAAVKFFELVRIPIEDVNAENALVQEGEDTKEAIDKHVDNWIAAHQSEFDGWVNEALAAAK